MNLKLSDQLVGAECRAALSNIMNLVLLNNPQCGSRL